jgi:hypothetical protein
MDFKQVYDAVIEKLESNLEASVIVSFNTLTEVEEENGIDGDKYWLKDEARNCIVNLEFKPGSTKKAKSLLTELPLWLNQEAVTIKDTIEDYDLE